MRIRSIAIAVTAALALAPLAAPVAARAFKKGDLTISAPWTRQTAAGQSVGGGFMRMRRLNEGLAIPPRGSVALAPGGLELPSIPKAL